MKENVLEALQNCGRPIILFGASVGGRKLYYFLRKSMEIAAFCDNYKNGIEPYSKLKIITPTELAANYADAIVCICAQSPVLHKEIYAQLLELAFPAERIFGFDQIADAIEKNCSGKLTWKETEAAFDWKCNHHTIEKMAQWIETNDHSVIDFGAGDCYLRQCLRPDIVYIPTDYVSRSPEFVVFDFNKDPFPFLNADVCFLGFVIHYMENWKDTLRKIFHAATHKVIIGIGCSTGKSISRLNGVLVEFYDDQDIITLAGDCGFRLQSRFVEPQGDGLVRNDILLLFVNQHCQEEMP